MNLPQVVISYTDMISEDTFDDFIKTVSARGLNLRIDSREETPHAGIEWLLPTAVIIFIGKSYFDGFLKEMGKEHYQLFKKGLKSLKTKLFGESAPKVVLISSKGKVSNSLQYSIMFSIYAETDQGQRIKLLFPADISSSDYDETIDAFLNFLLAYHDGDIALTLLAKISTSRVVGNTLLLTFNLDTKGFELLDPLRKT